MIAKVDIDEFILKTQKVYNNNIVNIVADPELCSLYGIKPNSCLNSQQDFQFIDGLPTGIAVDVMDDILLGLNDILFTTDFVNKAISSFEYSKTDRKNMPQPFKIIQLQISKTNKHHVRCGTLLDCFLQY